MKIKPAFVDELRQAVAVFAGAVSQDVKRMEKQVISAKRMNNGNM